MGNGKNGPTRKTNIFVVVDVEANGPAPGLYSMTSFGAVVVEPGFERKFGAGVSLLPEASIDPEAAKIDQSNYIQEDPCEVIPRFVRWVDDLKVDGERVTFASDNVAFDWSFINYYCWRFADRNPFGWSGRRIGDLYCGMVGDLRASWKHLRDAKHTHDPVSDALGNAEALLKIIDAMYQAKNGRAQTRGH